MSQAKVPLLLLVLLTLAPGPALARKPTPATSKKGAKASAKKPAKPKGPVNQVTVCEQDCPSDFHPTRLLRVKKCPDYYAEKNNAALCERNQGDTYLACGELCSMNYAADPSSKEEPSEACGKRPGGKGPMVRCMALGAPAPELPLAAPKAEATPK